MTSVIMVPLLVRESGETILSKFIPKSLLGESQHKIQQAGEILRFITSRSILCVPEIIN